VEHSNVNSLTLTVSTEKIWWVEPRYKQIKFPRHNVRLSISQYCASLDAAGCSATGTLIYKEDFGGNNVADPQYSSTALAQGLVDLVFCPNGGCVSPTYGYMFAKTLSSIHKHIEKIGGGDDHSAWNDKTHGYFMSIDPAANNMNYKVYGSIIKGLCTGTNLSFTLWAYDWHQEAASEARPKIEMLIRDARTMDTIITSGIITLHRENPAQNHVVWRQYGFDFSIPAGVDSVLFTIVNKEVSNIGNDWFLDDIEIRLCAPKVNMNILRSDTSVCFGNALDIIGTYLSDCTFGNELECRWEFRHVDSARWKVVTPAQANVLLADCSVTVPISKTLSITSANKVDEGYYRLYMSSPAGIGNANCRAASDSIYVKVIDRYAAPDIRIQTCAAPQNRQMQLSAYLDSTDYNSIRWEKISPFAPDIIDDEKGMINGTFAKDVIYKYKYTAKAPEESGCGSTSAIAYIKAQDGNVAAKIDTVAICCSGMDMNKYIQISSIFGLEFDGTFDYGSGTQAGNPDNTVANNVRVFGAPSKYHGALVFDAKKAYSEADAGYDIIYKGTNAKKFNFLYTGNCIPYKKRIVLIVIP
ncbi:MAG: hypothetical protein LBH60_08440, partial [Prevotellaceae bacterium]|nr:hypothetical protein [Prevotellaceae bacterium]